MKHHFLNDMQDIEDMLSYAKENKFTHVAFDLETDSVNENRAKVYGIGLAFEENEAFYIPVRSPQMELLLNEKTLSDVLFAALKDYKLIGHNIIYDCLVWDFNYNQDLSPLVSDDTILMKHLLDEEPPFGLKDIAVKYLGDWADKAQQKMLENIKKNGGTTTKDNLQMFKCDTDVLGEYCAWDVMLTFKLYNLFKPRIIKENLEELYNTEVMPLYKEVTMKMKRLGIPVNVPYFNKLLSEITNDIQDLETSLMAELDTTLETFQKDTLNDRCPIKRTGSFPRALAQILGEVLPDSLARKVLEKNTQLRTVRWIINQEEIEVELLSKAQLLMFFEKYPNQNYVFNLRSKTHLKYLFFDVLKQEPIGETESGEPQVDDDFLQSISKAHPWVCMLQDFNKLEKIKGTYIEGILERQDEGIIRASLLQFGTTSGRFASRNPNLQNLPRPKEEDSGLTDLVLKYVNSIRAGFIAPAGYVFVDADYSALEPRCFAHMSGDKNLQLIFHSGEDMYSSIAKRVFNLKDVGTFKKDANFLGKLYPEKRQIIKALALAVTYGAEAFRIADLLKVDRYEAQKLIDDYLTAYPGLKEYIKRCHEETNNTGSVKTIFGRLRHLPEGKNIHAKYGIKILDSRWARSKGLSDDRRLYKNKLNNSTNFKIQGLAAHIVNRAMININRELKANGIDGWVCLQVHDQIVATVKQGQEHKAKDIVQRCMETVATLSVPLIAEPKIAYNLKDSH